MEIDFSSARLHFIFLFASGFIDAFLFRKNVKNHLLSSVSLCYTFSV